MIQDEEEEEKMKRTVTFFYLDGFVIEKERVCVRKGSPSQLDVE